MTNNIALRQEQQQRLFSDLCEAEEAKNKEAALNTDIYSKGYFEGYVGFTPSLPEQHSYWCGYQIGYREYWAKKLGREIPTEF